MKVTVLVSTMHQKDYSIVERMNIQSDAIIINQCEKNNIVELQKSEYNIKILSLKERGVGLSRNTALMRATSDFVVFADDDETFVDGYAETIIEEFKRHPKADMLIFNVKSKNKLRPQYEIKKYSRVYKYTCLKYGAVRIAIRLDKLREVNVYFSLLFGGGAKYSNGEDSLFICECIDKGLKVYASEKLIGYVEQNDSTWFKGYNKKYFNDRGVLYKKISKYFYWLLSIRFLIKIHRHYKNDISFFKALKYMLFIK